jgi:site-specific DNA-methyltransferase (adenine-specific)
VDAIVTDPPYGLSFMGKNWDHGVPGVAFWREALRVAKPGAHLLAFGGTRTFHRLAVAIEDAGWEIRDCVMWVYGNGFPKSHDASKAIDKAAGAKRRRLGSKIELGVWGGSKGGPGAHEGWKRPWMENPDSDAYHVTAPATDAARQWDGWGTALKPAWEPVIVARKPMPGTVAENVLAWGTGAINVDGCRVEGAYETRDRNTNGGASMFGTGSGGGAFLPTSGRWPANVIHDGSDEVLALFPQGTSPQRRKTKRSGEKELGEGKQFSGGFSGQPEVYIGYGDTGSAARFFYCAKASKADRDEGLDGFEKQDTSVGDRRPSGSMSQRIHADEGRPDTKARNHHPTVKPTDLMRYLCRLVTPPGGTVLDPFCGSGSTGKAAVLEGFGFIGIDMESEYVEIAAARIDYVARMVPEAGRVQVSGNAEPPEQSGQLSLFGGL